MKKFIYDILVIGTGGTGSYFLKEFSRFLVGQKLSDLNIGKLVLCDGDIVEEHNLSRQSFIEDDIGSKKAICLADALNSNFDLHWSCYPQYITKTTDIVRLICEASSCDIHIPVIIGCVDNHGCRLLCEEFFKEQDSCIYFDSANEFSSGEVVFSYKLNGKQISPLRSEIFPDLKEGDIRNVTELSCEELNEHSPQHIATNMRAGNILLIALCGLLQNTKFYPGMTFFSVENMSEEYMPRRCAEEKEE